MSEVDPKFREIVDHRFPGGFEALQKRFTYQSPKSGQPERYEQIRDCARELAYTLVLHCPNSRELSTALTKLDEVVMHANASIARNE